MYLSIFRQNTALYFRQHCRLNICGYIGWPLGPILFRLSVLDNDKKIYISPIFLVLKQMKKILCIEPGHEKSPMENINDRSKFWKRIVCKCWKNTLQLLKKYFANVKQILYKCWKILCIVLDTRKAQWRNISVRSKFWQNILQMLKNTYKCWKILCKCWKFWKNTLHRTWTREKPNGETLVLEANLEYDCSLESSFWIVKRSFASHSFYL